MIRDLLLCAFFSLSLATPARAPAWAEDSPAPGLPSYSFIEKKPAPTTRVGDLIGLSIQEVTPPYEILPPIGMPSLDTLEDEPGVELLLTDSGAILVPLRAGKLTLPSLVIATPDGKPIARTNPWSVDVVSSVLQGDPDPKKPASLRPPWELSIPQWVWVVIASLGAILFAAIVYGIYRFITRKKPAPIETPKSEDEEALLALDELKKMGFPGQKLFKKHYFAVSEILKIYIGRRYGFDATECTTKELLYQLERRLSSGFQRERQAYDRLAKLFPQLDLVKFTDHLPSTNEPDQIVAEAAEFVRATRKAKLVVDPVAGQGAAK